MLFRPDLVGLQRPDPFAPCSFGSVMPVYQIVLFGRDFSQHDGTVKIRRGQCGLVHCRELWWKLIYGNLNWYCSRLPGLEVLQHSSDVELEDPIREHLVAGARHAWAEGGINPQLAFQ